MKLLWAVIKLNLAVTIARLGFNVQLRLAPDEVNGLAAYAAWAGRRDILLLLQKGHNTF
jgi:hypothetical protein